MSIKGYFAVPDEWAETGIDAALYSKKESALYFFKGGQYTKIKDKNDQTFNQIFEGFPKSIKGNWSIPEEWAT